LFDAIQASWLTNFQEEDLDKSHSFACANEVFDAPDSQSWGKVMRTSLLAFSVRQYFREWRKDFSSLAAIAQDIPDPVVNSGLYYSHRDPNANV